MKQQWIILTGLLVFITACQTASPLLHRHILPEPSSDAPAARQFYLAGALADFENNYHEALLQYYKALVYDSASAEINKAIGRNLFRLSQYQQATTYLKRALELQADNEEALYYLAECHNRLHNFGLATTAFEKLVALKPFHPNYHSKLEQLYTRLGAVEKLLALQEARVELLGLQDEATYQLLTLYMRVNRLSDARALLEALLREQPNQAMHWSVYASLLELEADTSGAVDAYRKALELEPFNERTQQQLFLLLMEQKRWDAIVSEFAGLAGADSANYQARLFLAEGYFYREEPQRAVDVAWPVLKVEAYKAAAHQLLGRIAVTRNHRQEAKLHFRALTELEPQNRQAWELLGVFHLQLNELDAAVEVFERAVKQFPGDARFLSLHGSALQRSGRYREGLLPLRLAHELDAANINTVVSLGLVYERLHRFAALDSLYAGALELYPRNALLLNNYSYSLADRGVNLPQALQMATQAVELEPENGSYLDTLGWVYYRLGEYQTAREYLRRALDKGVVNTPLLEHLGDVCDKLGDQVSARSYWQRALQLDPANNRLRQKVEK